MLNKICGGVLIAAMGSWGFYECIWVPLWELPESGVERLIREEEEDKLRRRESCLAEAGDKEHHIEACNFWLPAPSEE